MMSGGQAYGFASGEERGDGGNPDRDTATVDATIIARLPDTNRNCDRVNSAPSPSAEANRALSRRWPSVPKKAVWGAGTVVCLMVCWFIFAGSGSDTSDPESWRPAPPAASAPEAPPWNSEAEQKTVVAPSASWPIATSIKLDEVLPRGTTLENLAGKTPPPVLAIGTPIPPENTAANNRGWDTLSESEYYWTVRRRSEAESYRTAARPKNVSPGGSQPDGQDTAPARPATARLNGVIETPTVRVY